MIIIIEEVPIAVSWRQRSKIFVYLLFNSFYFFFKFFKS